MARAKVQINQVSNYNKNYYTSKKELGYLANFLTKFLVGWGFDFIQDAKGVLKIEAIYFAPNATENKYLTFELQDYDVRNVLDVLKSNEYPLDLVYKKFNLKFKKF